MNNSTVTSREYRIEILLSQMTLAEKIGQMTQVEKNSITPDDVTCYAIGSVLSGGGGSPTLNNTPMAWREMVTGFQRGALATRLGIPIFYGVDAVHGHNNVIGATIFPHNIGLGATRDPDLVARVARATALEILATGIHWDFAPCVAVPQDIRWGRTYEGYGETSDLVAELGAAFVRGMQNVDGITLSHPHAALASVKHYLGDGGTAWGSTGRFGANWAPDLFSEHERNHGIDQGVAELDEAALRTIHLSPYIAALRAGARNIMVSYSSWGGLKMHAQRYLLTTVLKEELGFDGFLVSDWAALDQIQPDDYHASIVAGINAGIDMVMVPWDYKRFIATLTRAVENGDVLLDRINDATRRILRVKLEMDLVARPFGDEALMAVIGGARHRALAREAVRSSLVLLKNEGALPVTGNDSALFVAGAGADDLGLQCGGWTIEWMGKRGRPTLGTTLLDALRQARLSNLHFHPDGDFPLELGIADTAIVVLAEPPYAEGVGDRANLSLPAADITLLERIRMRCRKLVLILYTGRPLVVTDQLSLVDGLIVAWLPGTEGQGVADILLGIHRFRGRLPCSWPRSMQQVPLKALSENAEAPLFPEGFGIF
ncbi:beta-glucosidase [Gammaproteobacteria bacterium]